MSEENTLLDTEATTEAPVEDQVETTEQSAEADAAEQLLAGKYKTAEDLESAYKSLESKIGEKEDAIRERLKEEMSQPKEGVPLSAGEYELPDFVDESEAVGNEALKSWSEHCFENGYSNEEFQKGLELYMNSMPQQQDLEKEASSLGDNATARIESASLFANKFFPEEAMPAIERMCEGADGIIALEAIMAAMKEPSMGTPTGTADAISEASLNEMMRDERYWNPRTRDDNFVKQVDSGFKKLYG
jgi:cytochrome c1